MITLYGMPRISLNFSKRPVPRSYIHDECLSVRSGKLKSARGLFGAVLYFRSNGDVFCNKYITFTFAVFLSLLLNVRGLCPLVFGKLK